MAAPLDQQEHNRTGAIRAARLFSNLVSPPVIFAVLSLLLSLAALPLIPALAWTAVYAFFVSLLPILFVFWLLRTGRVGELHMSDTRERNLPYLVAVLCSVLIYGIVVVFSGPELLRCLALFNILTLSALGLINSRWLISFHAAAIASAWAIVTLVYGWQAGLLVLPLVTAVVVVRLYLRRHTVTQVVAGMALGLTSVFSLTLIGCFV